MELTSEAPKNKKHLKEFLTSAYKVHTSFCGEYMQFTETQDKQNIFTALDLP